MNFIYDGDDYISQNVNIYGLSIWTYLNDLKFNGYLPSTIPVTFSGNTAPPSQVKVFMPDAYFPNKNKPINLGHVEEILTYDPDTLTYWGDVRTYAGIKGRIHFSIPNYYPLASSGTKYIVNSSQAFNQPSVSTYRWTIGGDFDDKHLNNFINNEFSLYETCYVEHEQPPYVWSNEIFESKFRMFVASDAYGGYTTGLAQGKTWFDSRIFRNYKISTEHPLDFVKRKTSKMLIAFSKWGTAKFNKKNGVRSFEVSSTGNDLSHYTRNFFAIKSVHPNAHITSLGI